MIETDLRTELLSNAAVTAIIGTRMFLKAPVHTQTQSYVTFHRQYKLRDMVSEKNVFKVVAFSQDMLELENLCAAIINALDTKTALNTNQYYSNSLVSQIDGPQKLDDGFFWSMMTFEFKHSI